MRIHSQFMSRGHEVQIVKGRDLLDMQYNLHREVRSNDVSEEPLNFSGYAETGFA